MRPTKLLVVLPYCVLMASACGTDANLSGQSQKENQEQKLEVTEAEVEQEDGREDPILTDAEIDLERPVIPPEVIAGSYLTCEFVEEDPTTYGCTVYAKNGDRLDLTDVKADWDLSTADGPVQANRIDVQPDSEYHYLWKLQQNYASSSLRANLTLYDEDGSPQQVQAKGVIVINQN